MKNFTCVGQAVLIVISCRATQRAKENKKPVAHTKLDEKTKIRIGKYLSENGLVCNKIIIPNIPPDLLKTMVASSLNKFVKKSVTPFPSPYTCTMRVRIDR